MRPCREFSRALWCRDAGTQTRRALARAGRVGSLCLSRRRDGDPRLHDNPIEEGPRRRERAERESHARSGGGTRVGGHADLAERARVQLHAHGVRGRGASGTRDRGPKIPPGGRRVRERDRAGRSRIRGVGASRFHTGVAGEGPPGSERAGGAPRRGRGGSRDPDRAHGLAGGRCRAGDGADGTHLDDRLVFGVTLGFHRPHLHRRDGIRSVPTLANNLHFLESRVTHEL